MSWSIGFFREETAQPGVKTGISTYPHVKNTDIIDMYWCRMAGFDECKVIYGLIHIKYRKLK
jgi:hypothetical protein